jgi:hypothetical protein
MAKMELLEEHVVFVDGSGLATGTAPTATAPHLKELADCDA